MEDVIRRQKLEAEIREGEEAVAGFTVTEVREDEIDATPGVDLTPSLSGAQTLSLAEDGEWRSEGVSEAVPLPAPGSGDQSLPPPPPPCRSFHHRFLEGRSSSADALKEIQKLKWTRDRTTSAVTDAPFPDLSEACHDLVEVMAARGLGQ